MKLAPTGLGWTGGKGIHSVPQGPWVNSLLPAETNTCYCEPYAGMAGVLLQRQPAKSEILNDTDGLLINWWQQVRDNYHELIRVLETTPHSRQLYHEAQMLLADGGTEIEPLERARLWTILVDQSIAKTMNKSGWSIAYSSARGRGGRHLGYWEDKLPSLARRIKGVHLENRPAVEILDRLAREDNTIIYCDPPYPTAASEFYGNAALDVDELAEVLLRQKGRVAISGFGEEWNMLGWERHECRGTSCGTPSNDPKLATVRVEVLWTNYPAAAQGKLL